MAHYHNAGVMLLEAKAQVKHGEWIRWVEQNFTMSYTTAVVYMRLAQKDSSLSFSSLREIAEPDRPPMRRIQPWHEPVKQAIDDPSI